jgi:hypothetical protein
MANDQEVKESNKPVDESPESPDEKGAAEGEFKVTVRKLEMPVRPRGVLAE